MPFFSLIDLKMLVIVTLFIIFLLANTHLNKHKIENKLFLTIILLTLFALFFEIVSTLLSLHTYSSIIVFRKLLNIFNFSVAPIIAYLFICYISKQLELRTTRYLLYPLFLNTCIVLYSYSDGGIFNINSLNQYERSKLFLIPGILVFLYSTYGVTLLLKHKNKLDKLEYKSYLVLYTLPNIGMIVQLFLTDDFVWGCTGMSIVIFYVYLREKSFQYDSLTKVWNRYAFETFIETKMENKSKTPYSFIYIDLDHFKNINDTYGHAEGNTALMTSARILKECFGEKGIVSRIGGDEFIVIVKTNKEDELTCLLQQMVTSFTDFNASHQLPYTLEFSYGSAIYNQSYEDVDSFLKYIDSLMYEQKKAKKTYAKID